MSVTTISMSDKARAQSLLGTRPIRIIAPGEYLIRGSERDRKTNEYPEYAVDTKRNTCTCPRFEKKLGYRDQACKHLGFFWMVERTLSEAGINIRQYVNQEFGGYDDQ